MAKLSSSSVIEGDETGPPQSELWKSLESVENLINAALPGLKCPICGSQSFTLVRDFSIHASPQISSYRWMEISPDSFIPTLTFSCDDCGHFLSFAEAELMKRAGRGK
jgi:hypothetical protein